MDERDKNVTISEYQLKKIINSTVNSTLTQLGIEHNDPLEMQKDFSHLREWRQSTERIKNKAFMSVVAIVITGFLALLTLGFKGLFGTH